MVSVVPRGHVEVEGMMQTSWTKCDESGVSGDKTKAGASSGGLRVDCFGSDPLPRPATIYIIRATALLDTNLSLAWARKGWAVESDTRPAATPFILLGFVVRPNEKTRK